MWVGLAVFHRRKHLLLGFAHRDPAYGIPVKVHLDERLGAFPAQIGKRGSLDDAELGSRSGHLLALAGPEQRALEALCGVLLFARIGRTLIKEHGDVRPEHRLDLHGFARPDEAGRPVDVALKMHARVGDFA